MHFVYTHYFIVIVCFGYICKVYSVCCYKLQCMLYYIETEYYSIITQVLLLAISLNAGKCINRTTKYILYK